MFAQLGSDAGNSMLDGDGPPHRGDGVSVLVAAYNEEKTIGHVIGQLLALSDINLKEIIVVDDGSRDRTAEIVEAFAARDLRVRLIHQEQNLGKAAAIARAVSAATGPCNKYP